ncbi:MAG: trypsin-like peptidase domain-containing protein [Chromatiaceae bacterium]
MLRRLRWIFWGLVLLLVLWQFLPWIERYLIGMTAEPRSVTARGDLAGDEIATIELFERASPTVVFISTRQRVMNVWTRNVLSVPRGNGSGLVWDDLGHVVTNNHVVEGASEATVRLNDGRSYRAVLIGSSPSHDLAVLRINVPFDRPPAVPIGTSGDLRVGQKVFAIGNPFGLDYTLTSGLISALDRSLEDEDGTTIEHLIQTDAAINPGNSGGPLLDSAGRLIGINTAIYSPSGAYAGIGFAVPVDTVNRVVPQLIAKGRYIRPSLGVSIDADVNRVITERLGVTGVVVLQVQPGSAAEAAGLRSTRVDADGDVIPGDVILAVAGIAVESISGLLSALEKQRIGDQITLRIWRDGREIEVPVVLQASA